MGLFCHVFMHSIESEKIGKQIVSLSQEDRGAAEYALEFH